MEFHCYKSIGELPRHVEDLIKKQSENNLYLSFTWYKAMLSAGVESKTEIYIYTIENDNRCLAALFLRSPAGQNGAKISSWNIHAQTLASLTNFQASFFSVLVDENDSLARQAIDYLMSNICLQKPAWHLVDLNLMSQDGGAFKQSQIAFERNNFSSKSYLYKGNWYENFAFSTFDEYLSARDKSSRKAIKNYQRKFRKLEKQERIKVKLFDGDEELETVLSIYQEIYERSWKELDFFEDFYPQLIAMTAKQGSLRFLCIYIDGKPAAFEFAIVTGTQCVMMRTSYIQDYQRESVGSVAIMLLIEHVIENDGVNEIDFGTDDDSYKKTWVSQRRERYGLISFNRSTPQGIIYLWLFNWGKFVNNLKHTIKNLIGRKTA